MGRSLFLPFILAVMGLLIVLTLWTCHHHFHNQRHHPKNFIAGSQHYRFIDNRITPQDIDAAKSVRDQIIQRCGNLDFLPKFNPDLYNDIRYEDRNNCYEYAMCLLNTRYPSKPQPGMAAGLPHLHKDQLSCTNLKHYIHADHPRVTFIDDFETPCPCGTFKVGLRIDDVSRMEKRDYHLFRQDNTGICSHKPGIEPVTLVDASNHYIINPDLADFDYSSTGGPNYCTSCGYICVPSDHHQVSGDAEHPLHPEWLAQIPMNYIQPPAVSNNYSAPINFQVEGA
jgi:hypothetical protein